ncbi:hypothetical protein ACFL01_01785, partial [Planctomycetota bacterium]
PLIDEGALENDIEPIEEPAEEEPVKEYVSQRKTAEQMETEENELREKAALLSSHAAACEREIQLAGEDVSRSKQDLRSLKEQLLGHVTDAAAVIAGVHPKTGEPVKLVFRDKDGTDLQDSGMPPSFKRKLIMLRAAEADLKSQEQDAAAIKTEEQALLQKAEQLKLKRETKEKDEELREKSLELKQRITESNEDVQDATAEAEAAMVEFKILGVELGKKHAGAKTIDMGKDQELLLKAEDGTVVTTMKMPSKMARRWEQYQRANKDAAEGRRAAGTTRTERTTVVEQRLEMRRQIRAAAPTSSA